MHLVTRVVVIHLHVETQVSEGLEKGLGISVRSGPDGHFCGSQAPVHGEQSSAEHRVPALPGQVVKANGSP